MAAAERGEAGTWRSLGLWDGGELALVATRSSLPYNDLTTAEYLSRLWPDETYYVPGGSRGRWHAWDGWCLRPDLSLALNRRIHGFAHWYKLLLDAAEQRIEVLRAQAGDDDEALKAVAREEAKWKPYTTYAAGLQKNNGLGNLRAVLAEVRGVDESVLAERYPDWVNTRSGLVSLLPAGLRDPQMTAEVYRNWPGSMITYCLDLPWDPAADCPMYRQMLWRATGGVAEIYEHLIKVLGYSMLGTNPKQLIYFLRGDTASGKSKLLEVATKVMGPLAFPAQTALVEQTRNQRNAREENSIRGMRLVTIAETSSKIQLEEAQVKRLTGQDELGVNEHYATMQHRTIVSWLIIIATNQMPSVAAFDSALRRRIIVIPMGPPIPENQRNDRIVKEIIETEAAGVLNLLIQGCRMAMAPGGLDLPSAVREASGKYASEQDTLAVWFEEHIDLVAGVNGHRASCTRPELWSSYDEFWRRAPHMGRNEFYDALAAVPGVELQGRLFYGLKLKYASADWTR